MKQRIFGESSSSQEPAEKFRDLSCKVGRQYIWTENESEVQKLVGYSLAFYLLGHGLINWLPVID